jgi:hypothetical protein
MASAFHRVLCRPIVVTSANNTIKFREDGDSPTRTATVTPGTYYLLGDDSVLDIIKAIAVAMTAAPDADNAYSVTAGGPLASTPFFGWTITGTGFSFIFFASGSTFPFADIGITPDVVDAATYSLSSSAIPQVVTYSPGVISSVQDPSGYENEGVYHHRTPDGGYVTGSTSDPVRRWPLLWEYVSKGMSLIRHETGQENSWEQFWRDINAGTSLHLYEGLVSAGVWTPTLVAEGTLSIEDRRRMEIARDSDVPTFRIEGVFIEDMT